MSTIQTNLSARLIQGRQLARQKHREGDAKKLGNLRAGNSGILSKEGDIAGSCPRVSHLRSLGIDLEEPSDSKLIMFQMGIANEDLIYSDLLHTRQANEVILREQEIPINWTTSNGTPVSGRPDMVVCQLADGAPEVEGAAVVMWNETQVIPIFGVEIKSIASVWTTRDVMAEGSPKLPHLIQAGHYSWKLGIPFRLLYKQYSNQAVPSWAGKLFPRQGESGSEHIEYNEKGDIKNINPFEIVYELEWSSSKDKHLRYRREGTTDWTKTLVSQADIERFYEFTSTMAETKELGSRPLTIDAAGKEKNYSNCSYCPLLSVCEKEEKKGYDKWLSAVKNYLKGEIK